MAESVWYCCVSSIDWSCASDAYDKLVFGGGMDLASVSVGHANMVLMRRLGSCW